MSTDAGTARGLRDRPLGKLAILVAILVVAFVASRSCAASGGRIDQDEAVTIAERRVDFRPDRVQVRFFRQGVPSRGFWAVSLTELAEDGTPKRRTLIVVDSADGRVDSIREQGP